MLHISLLVMNTLKQTESAIFFSFMHALLPMALGIQNFVVTSPLNFFSNKHPQQRFLLSSSLYLIGFKTSEAFGM